jgi:hypothetical protein
MEFIIVVNFIMKRNCGHQVLDWFSCGRRELREQVKLIVAHFERILEPVFVNLLRSPRIDSQPVVLPTPTPPTPRFPLLDQIMQRPFSPWSLSSSTEVSYH